MFKIQLKTMILFQVLPPKHDQITFLLVKLETSRLHHLDAFEYPVQKNLSKKKNKIFDIFLALFFLLSGWF